MDPADIVDYWTEPSRRDNSFRVVTAEGLEQTVLLDGLSIMAGHGVERITADEQYVGTIDGAGLYCKRLADIRIMDCAFRYNGAGAYQEQPWGGTGGGGGPAITCLSSTLSLISSVFEDNWAYAGGGAVLISRWDWEASHVLLQNCDFRRNETDGGGGAIDASHGTLAIHDCTFHDNVAGWVGGGAWSVSYCDLSATGCILRGNVASTRGGAIHGTYNSSIAIKNCLLAENTLTSSHEQEGDAIFISECEVDLANCTLAANAASNGAAMHVDATSRYPSWSPSIITIGNSILWNTGAEIVNADGSTISVTHSDVRGAWPGAGNKNAEPLFVLPGFWDNQGTPSDAEDDVWIEGDYHLLSNSPCIDAGDPQYVADAERVDIDGDPRVINGTVDMGADEYRP